MQANRDLQQLAANDQDYQILSKITKPDYQLQLAANEQAHWESRQQRAANPTSEPQRSQFYPYPSDTMTSYRNAPNVPNYPYNQ